MRRTTALPLVALLLAAAGGGTYVWFVDREPAPATEEAPPETPVVDGTHVESGEGTGLSASAEAAKEKATPTGPASAVAAGPTETDEAWIDWAIRCLTHERHHVRVQGAWALQRLGPKAARAVGPLVAAYRDDDVLLRSVLGAALASIGEAAMPTILEAAADEDPRVREGAVRALGLVPGTARVNPALDLRGVVARAIPALLDALKDPDEDVRVAAAWALGAYGADARFAVPALVAALGGSKRMKLAAARSLGTLGLEAPTVVPALSRLAGDASENEDVRSAASLALAQMGDAAKEAVKDLVTTAQSESIYASTAALKTIGALGPVAVEAIPALVRLALDEDSPVGSEAIDALGDVRPHDARALEALTKALVEQGHPGAAVALLKAGPAGLPALHAALAREDRAWCVESAYLGPWNVREPEATLSFLGDLLADDHPTLREVAMQSIQDFGEDGAPAIPAVVRRLADADPQARCRAVGVLGIIGRKSAEAAKAMARAIEDDDEGVRAAAVEGLARNGALADESRVALFARCLEDTSELVKREAMTGLARLGPLAKSAVPALEKLAKDPDPGISESAKAAIRWIEKK